VAAPYLPHVSDPLSFGARRFDLLRELLAVVFIVGMFAGLAWVGFATDWRLGIVVLSIAAGAGGVALGMNR
jgi:hypothetical protein